MSPLLLPILLFVACSTALGAGLLLVGTAIGPRRQSAVKQMPYESGMDPIHDARRRFDVRFHLVAVAFLLFDVEVIFLYPWAVASKDPQGLQSIGGAGYVGLILIEVLVFVALLGAGLAYVWRKGLFQWR